MGNEPYRIALYYDDSAYHETLSRPAQQRAGSPAGLMGRQVAGKEFLDAYLSHGEFQELVALAPIPASADYLAEVIKRHPSKANRSRPVRVFYRSAFHQTFLPHPPVGGIYFPCPPDPAFAWARQSGSPHGFSLSGVTHTLCTARAVETLRGMLTAPYEEYDRLICTSQSVARMVQNVWDAYAEYLKDRLGGSPKARIQIATIPLGVNVEKYRPATEEERHRERERLGIADDEIAVLFVGRLSHHAKAHPFPMYRGLAEASARTGQKVHLLMVGWAASAPVMKAFEDGARAFAPNVRVSFPDGLEHQNRSGVWHAADIFLSLSDNIQETFGLVIVEAMASGLPVVASDWNGYRDLVVPGETGFLVPTVSVQDSMQDLTSRLLLEELKYDHFLARSSQAVAVDVEATAKAFIPLFQDTQLRKRMGAAGRQRAEDFFSWKHIIKAYESLWQEQEQSRQEQKQRPAKSFPWKGPAAYPAPEWTFAGYPTLWLEESDLVEATSDAKERLATLLRMPLTNHVADSRSQDLALLSELLTRAANPCPLGKLESLLESQNVMGQFAKATLGWLLKYDLLRRVAKGDNEL